VLTLLAVIFLALGSHIRITHALTTGQEADIVLGQADFTGWRGNRWDSVASNTLYLPIGIMYANNTLYVVDSYNYRVLIWNSLPTENGQSADRVLGQPDLVSNGYPDEPNDSNFYDPVDVYVNGDQLFVTDLS